jgi:hypothetical protein
MVQFIGNVLTSHADADQHEERDKEHFHITPSEAKALDATGLPVHLEHADNVKVGKVVRSWDDEDGKKWVLADVDTSTIEGKFVKNDLTSANPIYSGLSLQHMYRKYADGRSSKSGIEVSICKEPRRPGCSIVHASAATEAARYKVRASKGRSMTQDDTTKKAEETPAAETPVVELATKVEASAVPSTTQLMAEVVEASRQNTDLQEKLAATTKELAGLNAKADAERNAAFELKTQMAQELGDAVLEHVAKLDPTLAGEETSKAIATLREKYPAEVTRVLEVACAASKHAKGLEDQLAKFKEETDRKLMEQAYHAAVANRPGCHGTAAEPTAEVAVHASKKARTDENPYAVRRDAPKSLYDQSATISQIQEAYSSLSRGSTTDAMRDVAGIITSQRNAGFR